MNNESTRTQLVDTAAESLVTLLTGLLEALFGSGITRPVLGDISWADTIVLLCFLALVVFVNGLVAWLWRRKVARSGAEPETREWYRLLFTTVAKPLYLLIWIYGI
jgi:hypothetical protein